jgi:hypothetical protein
LASKQRGGRGMVSIRFELTDNQLKTMLKL